MQEFTAVAVRFEKSSFKLLRYEFDCRKNAEKLALEIESDTKAVIVFSDDKNTNGDYFVEILNKMKSDFILAGGHARASRGAPAEQGYVFDKNGIMKKGSLALILNGSQLKAKWAYSMGWDSISREMEITKAENQVVYELDGRNIFQVYSEFLGEDIKDKLPSPKAGFLTNGEFGTIADKFEFLNITSTVLYLSEKKEVLAKKIEFDTEKPDVRNEHLFHLSKKVVSELEMINEKMRRANQATGNSKIEETAANLFKMLFDDLHYTGGIVIKEAENLTKIYLDDSLGAEAYSIFKALWDKRPADIN